MKINRKNQLLDSILMMQECHKHIMQSKDSSEQIELLQLCQDMAVQVGTLIEEQVSDSMTSQSIVETLEQYCDEVFKVSQVIEMGSEAIGQAIGVCESTLGKAQDNINNLQSEKMVAVFLPYNASMWDALDTVCRSAMKEDDWDTYVMPIPYYSLTTERKVDKNHFEYDLFSQELPLVDYRKCPLESLQPDVIFYHNPYDDYNLVTSVHPDFYSRNLLKITKQLVYIPYYLSEQKTGEYMVALPGVRNAWKVVVQTESIRNQFLEQYPEDKIINLGSPKMDRLMEEVNHPSKLPLEWKNKIEGKKVVFFNTHLTSVMNQPEKFLDMLTYVMEVMERNQEIVVLWRPHPLMKETITSFHQKPFLKKQYEQCVQTFQSLPNAIYDETSELHRSMAISSAYMGTQKSSVFRMYKHLKRPIYIMNDIFAEKSLENTILPRSGVGVIVGDTLWQVDYRINALFKTDMISGISTYMTTFKGGIWMKPSYNCGKQYKGWLICVPILSRNLVLYEMTTGRTEYVELEEQEFTKSGGWYVDYYAHEILLARRGVDEYCYQVSLDMFTSEKICLSTQNQHSTIVGIYEQEIWTYTPNESILESYHPVRGTVRQYKVPSNLKLESAVLAMHVEQDDLYMVDREHGCLMIISNYLGEYEVQTVNLGEGERRLTLSRFLGTTLFLAFANSTMLYAYEVSEGKLQVVVQGEVNVGGTSYPPGAYDKKQIVIMPSAINDQSYRIQMNNQNNDISIEEYKVVTIENGEELKRVLDESHSYEMIISDEIYGMEGFLQTKVGKQEGIRVEETKAVGKDIWEYITGCC